MKEAGIVSAVGAILTNPQTVVDVRAVQERMSLVFLDAPVLAVGRRKIDAVVVRWTAILSWRGSERIGRAMFRASSSAMIRFREKCGSRLRGALLDLFVSAYVERSLRTASFRELGGDVIPYADILSKV
jgi:hypothetical protein